MPRVLIGAAHTLESPGQIYKGLKEADLTRKILKKVVPELEKLNIDFKPVPLDLPLLDRIEWINSTGYTEQSGDIFVEIHVNDGGKRGIESWYKGSPAPNNRSQILAEKINESICKETGYQNQGAKSEHDHELGSLLILNQINCIGTTVELLYIDNEEDIKILTNETRLDELAKALANAINNYLSDTPQRSTTEESAPKQDAQPFGENSFLNATPSKFFGQDTFSTASMFNGNAPTQKSSSGLIMDREERKKMIKEIYLKVMGKEPNQTDLNLYLNQGITKEDLYAKLCESAEHEKLVKNAQEFNTVQEKLQKSEAELMEVKTRITDLNHTLKNYTELLHHKNTYIAQLKHRLVENKIILKGEYYRSKEVYEDTQTNQPVQNSVYSKRRKGLGDLIMKILRI